MFDVMHKLSVNDSLYCNKYTLSNIETMTGTSVNSNYNPSDLFARARLVVGASRIYVICRLGGPYREKL